MIEFDVVETPAGPCTVALRDGRVFHAAWGRGGWREGRRRKLPRVRRWVASALADGARHVPLDLSAATPFERRVYEAVRRIPPGRTLTYGEVARAAGRPGAARAVGRAMGRNPISLFVP